jgi:hypothetical protein
MTAHTTQKAESPGFQISGHEAGLLGGVIIAAAVHRDVKHHYKEIMSRVSTCSELVS